MRRYETVFILRPDLGEAQTKDTVKRFEGIIASGGGELVETEEWGVRELAYRIKGERRGYYVRLDYVSPGTVTNEVERNLKLADNVVRYLSVMVDDDADIAAAHAEVEAHRQRRAAALQARATPEAAAEAPAVEDAPEEIMDAAAEMSEPEVAAEAAPESAPQHAAEDTAEVTPADASAEVPAGAADNPPASESGGKPD